MDGADELSKIFRVKLPQREYVLRCPDTDSQEDLNRWHTNLSTAAATFRLGGGSSASSSNT
eukprot:SAG31_NODE_42676_length_270_cov_0.906433_1_plen_60_part_10